MFAINVADDKLLGGSFKLNTRSDLWPIYNPDSPIVLAPHSIYFDVLGEHGYIGLSIFLTLLFTAMITCSRTVKLTKHRPDLKWAGDLSKMRQVSLVGYCAAGAFLNLSTFDLFYHVLAIIVIARLFAMQELAKPYVEATDAIDTDDAVGSSSPAIANKAGGALAGAGRNTGAPGHNPVLGGVSGYLIKRR